MHTNLWQCGSTTDFTANIQQFLGFIYFFGTTFHLSDEPSYLLQIVPGDSHHLPEICSS